MAASIMMAGKSQYFFLTDKNLANSKIKLIATPIKSPIYIGFMLRVFKHFLLLRFTMRCKTLLLFLIGACLMALRYRFKCEVFMKRFWQTLDDRGQLVDISTRKFAKGELFNELEVLYVLNQRFTLKFLQSQQLRVETVFDRLISQYGINRSQFYYEVVVDLAKTATV